MTGVSMAGDEMLLRAGQDVGWSLRGGKKQFKKKRKKRLLSNWEQRPIIARWFPAPSHDRCSRQF